ncbi:hypothetical protein [Acidovorax sp. sic0104]|uniref:hypothetical protein n=1 Tax=Acidovorax sp. sic0104 TaxID=2854784 RepID=UPI001C448E96|nr:hypothetical protein [Acidovorax sp. sic0104]
MTFTHTLPLAPRGAWIVVDEGTSGEHHPRISTAAQNVNAQNVGEVLRAHVLEGREDTSLAVHRLAGDSSGYN